MANAHETRLQTDPDPGDTDADMQNNATAIRMASDPKNDKYSCGELADHATSNGTAAYAD
jgi:hypothetical protein